MSRRLFTFACFTLLLVGVVRFLFAQNAVVGQTDGDVYTFERLTVSPDGKLFSWDKHGQIKAGWPKDFSQNPTPEFFTFAPRLKDIDFDLQDEILAVTQRQDGSHLTFRIFKGNGAEMRDWSFDLDRRDLLETPMLEDVDHDGSLDLIFATTEKHVVVFRRTYNANPADPNNGSFKDFGLQLPAGVVPKIAVGDPDNNGLSDLFVVGGGLVYKWDPLQENLTNFALPTGGQTILGTLQFEDINNDGYPDILFATSGNKIVAADRNGRRLVSITPPDGQQLASGVVVEDVDLDRQPELIVLTQSQEILAFEMNGTVVARWQQPLLYRQPLPSAGVVANDLYAGLLSSATGWDLYSIYRNKLGGYSRILQGENVHEWDDRAAFHFVEPIQITDVFAHPKLFTPNNDGINDNTFIHYRLSEEGIVWWELYDRHDHLISTIRRREAESAEVHNQLFQGLDVKGTATRNDDALLDSGAYVVKILAQSKEGFLSSAKAEILVNGIKAEIESPAEETVVFGQITLSGIATDPNIGEGNLNADFRSYKLYSRPGRWNPSPEEVVEAGRAGSGWLAVAVPARHQCPDNSQNEPADAAFPNSNVSCRPVQHGVLGTFDAHDPAVTPNGDYTLLLKTLDSNGNAVGFVNYDTVVLTVRNPLQADEDGGVFGWGGGGGGDILDPNNPDNPRYRGVAITEASVEPPFITRDRPSTTIHYTLEGETADIHVDIFKLLLNEAGQKVLGPAVTAFSFNRQAEGEHSFVWNGTNSLGRNVDGGDYRIRITANAVDGTGVAINDGLEVNVARGFSARDILTINSFVSSHAAFDPFEFDEDVLDPERTTLSFSLSKRARVYMAVFDRAPEQGGILQRALLSGQVIQEGRVNWDGTGDNGVILPVLPENRPYIIRLTAESVDIGNDDRAQADVEVRLQQLQFNPNVSARLERLVGDEGEAAGHDDPLSAMVGSSDFIWRARGIGYTEVPYTYQISAYGEETYLRVQEEERRFPMDRCYDARAEQWGGKLGAVYNHGFGGFKRKEVRFPVGFALNGLVIRSDNNGSHTYSRFAPYDEDLAAALGGEAAGYRAPYLGQGNMVGFSLNQRREFNTGAEEWPVLVQNGTIQFSFYAQGQFGGCQPTDNVCPTICKYADGKVVLGPKGADCPVRRDGVRVEDFLRNVPLYNCGELVVTASGNEVATRGWSGGNPERNSALNSQNLPPPNTALDSNLAVFNLAAVDKPKGVIDRWINGYQVRVTTTVNGQRVSGRRDGDLGQLALRQNSEMPLPGLTAWLTDDGGLHGETTDTNHNLITEFRSDRDDAFLPGQKISAWHRGFNRDRFQPSTDPIQIYTQEYQNRMRDPREQIYTFSDVAHIQNWEVEVRYPNISIDKPEGENLLDAGGALNIFSLEEPQRHPNGVRHSVRGDYSFDQNAHIEDTFRLKLLPEAQPKRFIEIHGSAAANYELFYYDASKERPHWYRIPVRTVNAVGNGLLAHWDVTRLNGKNYTLVLRTTDAEGNINQDRFNIGIGKQVDTSNLQNAEFARVFTPLSRASVILEQGALEEPALITINPIPRNEADFTLPNGVTPIGPIFEILPDGLQMNPNHHAQLEVIYTPQEIRDVFGVADASEIQIYHLSADNVLEPLATLVTLDEGNPDNPSDDVYRITAMLDHFSQYLLARKRFGEFRITSPRSDQFLKGVVQIQGRFEREGGEPVPVTKISAAYLPADVDENAVPELIREIQRPDFDVEGIAWDVSALNGNFRLLFDAENAEGEKSHFEMPVAIDNQPTLSTLLVDGEAVADQTSKTVDEGAVIEIVSRDRMTGVARIELGWDGGIMEEYRQPFSVPFMRGTHTIAYRAIDQNGNVEEGKAATIIIQEPVAQNAQEGVAGDVTLTLDGPRSLQNRNQTFINRQTHFVLSANGDRIRQIRYRVGEAIWREYSDPFVLEGAEGIYTLEYFSVNDAGNRGPVYFKDVILDATPPVSELQVSGQHQKIGNTYYVVPSTTFSLSARDLGVHPVGLGRIEYRADNEPWQMYLQPRRAEEICFLTWRREVIGGGGGGGGGPPGQVRRQPKPSCIFSFRSVDALGNVENEKSVELKVDDIAPSVRLLQIPNVISPNDDGRYDTLDVTLTGADNFFENILISLKLTGRDGNLHTVWNRRRAEGEGEIKHAVWDGLLDGAPLLEDIYTYEIQFSDYQGNVLPPLRGTLTYDLTPPTVQAVNGQVLNFSPNGDNISDILNIGYRIQDNLARENLRTELHVETPGGFHVKADEVFVGIPPDVHQFLWDGTNLANNPAFDGTYRFHVISEDPAGNRSQPRAGEVDESAAQIFIDRVPPRTLLKVDGPHNMTAEKVWLGPPARIQLVSEDPAPGSGIRTIRWTLGDAPFVLYRNPFTVPMEGSDYRLRFTATDNVGNRELEQTRTLRLDSTPPQVTVTFGEPKMGKEEATWIGPQTPVVIDAGDNNGAGVDRIEYRVGQEEPQTYEEPFALKPPDGVKTIFAWAFDNVENRSEEKMVSVSFDATPPVTRLIVGDPKFVEPKVIYVTSKTEFKFEATTERDDLEGTEYRLDDGKWLLAAPFRLPEEKDYEIFWRSFDLLKNIEPEKNQIVVVDNTAPDADLALSQGQGDDDVTRQTQISLAGDTTHAGIETIFYRIDGGAWQIYRGPFSLAGLVAGAHVIEYYSRDRLGNVSQRRQFTAQLIEVRITRTDFAMPRTLAYYVGSENIPQQGRLNNQFLTRLFEETGGYNRIVTTQDDFVAKMRSDKFTTFIFATDAETVNFAEDGKTRRMLGELKSRIDKGEAFINMMGHVRVAGAAWAEFMRGWEAGDNSILSALNASAALKRGTASLRYGDGKIVFFMVNVGAVAAANGAAEVVAMGELIETIRPKSELLGPGEIFDTRLTFENTGEQSVKIDAEEIFPRGGRIETAATGREVALDRRQFSLEIPAGGESSVDYLYRFPMAVGDQHLIANVTATWQSGIRDQGTLDAVYRVEAEPADVVEGAAQARAGAQPQPAGQQAGVPQAGGAGKSVSASKAATVEPIIASTSPGAVHFETQLDKILYVIEVTPRTDRAKQLRLDEAVESVELTEIKKEMPRVDGSSAPTPEPTPAPAPETPAPESGDTAITATGGETAPTGGGSPNAPSSFGGGGGGGGGCQLQAEGGGSGGFMEWIWIALIGIFVGGVRMSWRNQKSKRSPFLLIPLALLLWVSGVMAQEAPQPVTNTTGVQPFTPYQFFSQGEAVNLSNGAFALGSQIIEISVGKSLQLGLYQNLNFVDSKIVLEDFMNSFPGAIPDRNVNREIADDRWESVRPSVERFVYENSQSSLGVLGRLHSQSERLESGDIRNRVFLEVGDGHSLVSWNEYVGIVVLMHVNPNLPERSMYVMALHKDGSLEPFNFSTGASLWKKAGRRITTAFSENLEGMENLVEMHLVDEINREYTFNRTVSGRLGHRVEYVYHCLRRGSDDACRVSYDLENWRYIAYVLKKVEGDSQRIQTNILELSSPPEPQVISASNGATITRRLLENGSETWETNWLNGQQRQWRASFDNLRRITEIIDPEGNLTAYKYNKEAGVRGGVLPIKRLFGWDNLVDPNYFVQVEYPTGGVARYEWFGNPNQDELFNRYVIVTEFPDFAHTEIAYQKYVLIQDLGRRGDDENQVRIVANVYHANGSFSEYHFKKKFGRMLLAQETTRADNQSIAKTYTWSENADEQRINGVHRIEMSFNNGPKSVIYSASYDNQGRITAQANPAGNVSLFEYYNDTDRLAQETTGNFTVLYGYDGRDACSREIPSPWLSHVRRQIKGQPKVIKTFCYDDYGNIVKAFQGPASDEENKLNISYAEAAVPSGSEQNRYDQTTGILLSQTNAHGVSAGYSYNQIGALTAIRFPEGAFLNNVYELRNGDAQKQNRIITTTHDNTTGRDVRMERIYNGIDQMIALKRGDEIIRYTYTPDKNLQSIIYPDDQVEAFDYDGFGRLSQRTISGFAPQQFEYSLQIENNIPLQVTTVKINGRPMERLTHDLSGRLRKLEKLDGEQILTETSYEYDSAGNLSRIATPSAKQIVKSVDYNKGVTTQTFPGGETISSEDSSGLGKPDNVVSGGLTTTLSYSASGLVNKITYPNDEVASTISHGALGAEGNAFNRLTNVGDAFGTTSFQYSPQGMAEVIERKLNDFQNESYKFYQVKDSFGNLIRQIYPNGLSIYYKRDELERVTEVRKNSESGLLLASIEYAANGEPSQISYANGVVTTYEYDAAGRANNISSRKEEKYLLQESYTYDGLGRKTEVRHLDGSRVVYDYDGLGRVTQARYFKNGQDQPYDTQIYAYDVEGNRTSYRDGKKDVQYIVDKVSGRVTGYRIGAEGEEKWRGTLNYERGNVVRQTESERGLETLTKTLVFDSKNQLTQITVNGRKTDFSYDYAGRREKVKSGGKSTYYLYGESLDPLIELDGQGEVQAFHIYIGSRRLGTIAGDGLKFYHADELDNVLKVTNEDGEEAQSVRYDPFGNITFLSGSDNNTFLFSGKPFDRSTGLIYFGARYYDPQLGRFLSRDPLFQGTNHYLYSENNPLNNKDVFGLWSFFLGVSRRDDGATQAAFMFEAGDFSFNLGAPIGGSANSVTAGFGYKDFAFAGAFTGGEGKESSFTFMPGYKGASLNQTFQQRLFVSDPQRMIGVAFDKNGLELSMVDLNFFDFSLSPKPFSKQIPLVNFSQLQNEINFNPTALMTSTVKNGISGEGFLLSVQKVLDRPESKLNFGGAGSVDSLREGGEPNQGAGGGGGGAEAGGGGANPRLPKKFSPTNPPEAGGLNEKSSKHFMEVQRNHGNVVAVGSQGGADFGKINPSDPILLHSGEFIQTDTDLKIPGRSSAGPGPGLDFEFTRTYRSRIEYDGPLGWGWDHNYNKRLIVNAENGNIARFDGEARFDIYVKKKDECSFTSPPGYFDFVFANCVEGKPNGVITITDKFGTVNTYAEDGWITQITDRNGNQLQFGYDDGVGDAKKLLTVTDTIGRVIRYAYSAAGKLSSITDFAGRIVRFAYDAHGDLVSVTNPADAVVQYTYSSGYGDDRSELNHNLLRITDAKNQPYLENTYSIYDRVVKQKFGHEGEFQMEYHQVASSQECTAELTGTIFYRTRLRDRVGNLVDYTFNCQGNPLSVEKQTRGVRAAGAGDGAGGGPNGAGDPARYVTKYCYNGEGLLTRLVQPKGNSIEYGYDPKGNMLVMRKRESAPATCAAPFAEGGAGILTTAYTYDPNFSQPLSVTDSENRATTFQINNHGNITQKCLPPATAGAEAICERYQYNLHGQLTQSNDGERNAVVYTYDEITGRLTSVSPGAGVISHFGYDAIGNITRFTDGEDQEYQFVVDALNRVTQESGPLGYERMLEYDANNNLTRISGASAVATTFSYDILDRVRTKEEVVGEGRTALTEYQYDLNENLIRVIEPEGNSTFIEYDERDLPYQVTKGYRSDEATTQIFDYDPNGNVARVLDGKGGIVGYIYDGHDRLLTVTDPLGNEMHLEHDDVGNIQAISRRGPPAPGVVPAVLARTEFIYDALNRLVRRTEKNDPSDSISRYIYDKAHRLIWFFNANNHATRFEYDEADRLVYRRDALGNIERFRYDGNGNLLTAASSEVGVDANGAPDPNVREIFTDTFFYDALNRPLSRTDNSGNVTRYQYDDRGNLISTTDAEGNIIHYCYDRLNRLVKEVKGLRQDIEDCSNPPDGAVATAYQYDDNNRLIEITDAKGNETQFGYDALNRQVRVELGVGTPQHAVYAKSYDRNGNLIEERQPNGHRIESIYDEANRLVEKVIHKAGVADERETFQYDGLSRMLSARALDAAGSVASSVAFTYDKLSRLLSETQALAGQNSRILSEIYDPVGNLAGKTYPSGKVFAYGYDPLNRLSGISETIDGIIFDDSRPVLKEKNYIGIDRVKDQTFGNDQQGQFRYDSLKRLAGVKVGIPDRNGAIQDAAAIFRVGYGYDKVGNRLTEEGARGRTVFENEFRYDSLYRLIRSLTETTEPGAVPEFVRNQWVLDPVDNWERRIRGLTQQPGGADWEQAFAVNNVNAYERIEDEDGEVRATYRYDANGNLIEDGEKRYEYNFRNLLTKVSRKGANGAPDAEVASYGYDALGRRISKSVVNPADGRRTTTQYIYEGVHAIAEVEADAQGRDRITKEFIYGDSIDDPVAMVVADAGGGEPAYYYYHTDGQGSVISITNAQGAEEERYSYDAYGEATINVPAGADANGNPLWAVAEDSAVGNPFLYTGQRYDAETGFYYYKARYYHPTLGRFLQRDPLGYVDGYNLYAYVNNNPLNFIDPLGLNKSKGFLETLGGNVNDAMGQIYGIGQTAFSAAEGASKFNLPYMATHPEMFRGMAEAVVNYNDTYNAIRSAVHQTIESYKIGSDFERGRIKGRIAGEISFALAGTKGIGSLLKVERTALVVNEIQEGAKVFRVWGGKAGPWGESWTAVNPNTVGNFRSAAGLPDVNTGRFVSEGILQSTEGVTSRGALVIKPGQQGNLSEFVIKNAEQKIKLQRVSGTNPEF